MSSFSIDNIAEYEKVSLDESYSAKLPQPYTISKIEIKNISGQPSQITQAKANMAKYYLERHFKEYFSRNRQIRVRNKELRSKCSSQLDDTQILTQNDILNRQSRRTFKLEQFEKIQIIGRGSFGEVWLVKDKTDQHVYAMKVLKKRILIQRNQILNTIVEKDFYTQYDNPWSAKLYYSFQDQNHLYLIMEFLPGGDLMNLLIHRNILTETETKFLIAEAALAIHHVHLQGFIHRDIKPDNLLLTKDGHVRLIDFGLSTKINRFGDPMVKVIDLITDAFHECAGINVEHHKHQKYNRFVCSAVGTTDYIAPEVLMKKSYGPNADFWSLGAIMFEMLYGYAPFMSSNPQLTANKIIHFEESLIFPPTPVVSKEAIALMRGLLTDSENRMTFEEIKQHPFFPGIDWDDLHDSDSPCVPELSGELDTSHFESIDPIPEENDFNSLSENDKEFEDLAFIAFFGFDYNKKVMDSINPTHNLQEI